jgi:hypothetical protein
VTLPSIFGLWDVDGMLFRVSPTPEGGATCEVWTGSAWKPGGNIASATWNGVPVTPAEAASRFGVPVGAAAATD